MKRTIILIIALAIHNGGIIMAKDRARDLNGVEAVYAIQAGREVRVVADSDRISDADTERLAEEISKRFETDITFPGPVKITVIREVRAMEMAR